MTFGRVTSIAFLVFIASVSAQISNENMCRVPAICDDPPTTQWRTIDLNGSKGGRGSTGEMGPPGPPGEAETSWKDQEIEALKELRQIKETFTEKLEEVEQNVVQLKERVIASKRPLQRYLDGVWGKGGVTASNGYRYKKGGWTNAVGGAKADCRKMRGRLAYKGIRNETVYREIIAGLEFPSISLCIDFRESNYQEGDFAWGDGVPLSETWVNWANGQPDNNPRISECGGISHLEPHGWEDINCNGNCYSLCEQRLL